MHRCVMLLAGALTGLVLAGVGAALWVPFAPERWRTREVIWILTAGVVAVAVGASFLLSRPPRQSRR